MPKAVPAAKAPTPDVTNTTATRTDPKQSREGYWAPLPGSTPVGLIDLRSSTCRWPVDDPRHKGVVRFCGSECGTEASYCAAHKKMGSSPSRGSVSRPTFFKLPTASKVA